MTYSNSGVSQAKAIGFVEIDPSCSNITIQTYSTSIHPNQPFTVTGSMSATGSPSISVGITTYKKQRPAMLTLATVSGQSWSATLSTEYLNFYIWAEYTLQDSIFAVSCLVPTASASQTVCPEPESRDESSTRNFRREYGIYEPLEYNYYGGDTTFYYGGT
ncbi:MAG: hypothetical protein KGH75_01550 [Rhodospirillales bacterium]|nr:hypothetical protein [Rhodospirillales bacterium]